MTMAKCNQHKIPAKPLETNPNMFTDVTGGFFFWDETQTHAYGPYDTKLQAKYEMFRYGQYLDGINAPSFKSIKPFLDQLLEDQEVE